MLGDPRATPRWAAPTRPAWRQNRLLLEAQEGHYEDLEELEGTVEQAIEEGTNILDNLEAGSQQARTTAENILAIAKAARDAALVLAAFGGLGLLLLWALSQKAKYDAATKAKASSPTPTPEEESAPAPTPSQAPAKVGIQKME